MKNNLKICSILTAGITILAANNAFAVEDTANVKVRIPESLSISLDKNELLFSLNDSTLEKKTIKVTGETNNSSGYGIWVNTGNDFDSLKNQNVFIEDEIPTLSGDTNEADFPAKSWGYSGTSGVFTGASILPKTVFRTSTFGETEHDFVVGVAGGDNIVSGSYFNSLVFTITANPTPIATNVVCNPQATTISQAVCMQDMNQDIIDSLGLEEQYQLIDSRDGKSYWFAKLADGNVWMTQNLDLDLSTNMTLTSADTDLNSVTSWTPMRDTIGESARESEWQSDYYTPYSWDAGNVFEVIHWRSTTGDIRSSCWLEDRLSSPYCERFVEYKPAEGGMHWQVGNYYNWSAAVASNDTSTMTMGSVAPDSICPKGWRLTSSSSEITTLMRAYPTGQPSGYSANAERARLRAQAPLYLLDTSDEGTFSNQMSAIHTYVDTSIASGLGRNSSLIIRCMAR
jgi:hypothetical protein